MCMNLSKTVKKRDSNMELLRIIAMVFIVLLHTNAQMMDKNEYPFYLIWA